MDTNNVDDCYQKLPKTNVLWFADGDEVRDRLDRNNPQAH